MHKYYCVNTSDNPWLAVVTSPEGIEGLAWIHSAGYIERPQPVLLCVKKHGIFTDALRNNLGVFLCSPRLRDVIEEHRSPADAIQWIESTVMDGDRRLTYYLLHFPTRTPVLHMEKTEWIKPGDFLIPVLDRELVRDRSVFNVYPDSDLWIIFREDVKAAIEAARCTGLTYILQRVA